MIICIYFIYQYKYAVVIWDDIRDIIVRAPKDTYTHGRYFTETFAFIFIKIIPKMFNIPVQNYAFISEGLTKSVFLTFIIYLFGKCFSYKNKYLNSYNLIIYIISIFVLISLMSACNNYLIFETMQFFCGYIIPLVFFIPLWLKISDYYLCWGGVNTLSKKDILKLCILAFLTGMGNEIFAGVTSILLFLLFLENILKIKNNNEKINSYVYLPLIFCLISVFFSSKAVGTQALIDNWGITWYFNINSILIFLKILIKIVFIKNLFLWLPSVIGLIILKFSNIENKNKIIRYIIYTYLGLLFFYISLYFLGETYPYYIDKEDEYYMFPRFWFLYSMLLLNLRFILYISLLYITGNIINLKLNKELKITLILAIIFSLLSFIFHSYDNVNFSDVNKKRNIYITDKMAVFYFKQGKNAILPAETANDIISAGDGDFPFDLIFGKYENKIYYENEYPIYFKYLKQCYLGMSEIPDKSGIIFKPTEEAMNDFYNNGGILEPEELTDLNFGLIK